ncbi:MAG TPA: SDR family oxidoreductase [Solirubrobacteraceae bacterium]|nr:SDR family oxidoreductase [Solirubrobacteraceae bacterium]
MEGAHAARPPLSTGGVLLTGATGFVGSELVARWLERTARDVTAIVRAADDADARARIDDVLDDLFGERAEQYRERTHAVAGDITAPGLGLTDLALDELAERSSTIVHSAASVSFTLPLAQARAINLHGTRRILDLAGRADRRGGLDCFCHVSTAYVAGDHTGRFAEADLDLGQGFHNSYERSKFEAEQLVATADLPTRVMRPSIIVGECESGWTPAFNVLYWPLRALSRGVFTAIPAYPSSPVDVVSIDYVADAVYALCGEAGADGETYHLIAGPQASTMSEICAIASRYFHRPAPRVVAPPEFAKLPPSGIAAESALTAGRIYFPYFSFGSVFDGESTRARLEPAGIRCTPLADYLERLLDFATRSRWGKRRIRRADALAV